MLHRRRYGHIAFVQKVFSKAQITTAHSSANVNTLNYTDVYSVRFNAVALNCPLSLTAIIAPKFNGRHGMSQGKKIFSRRIGLLGAVTVPLLFAVACSSDPRTCAEGNKSNACFVHSRERNDQTGSIRQPKISSPATVRTYPQSPPPYYVVVRRPAWQPKPLQAARYRRAIDCEATGSIRGPVVYNGYHPPSSVIATDRLTHPFVHIVRRGETLYTIARRYNVPLLEIARYNDIDYAASLRMGTSLYIPLT
jgi:LysM repeat protein